MDQSVFRTTLDKFNATSPDICASVLMTKDGLALVSGASQGQPSSYDEDKMSALSASILHLGHKFMDDFAGGGLGQVLIKGREGNMLAIHGQQLALAVLAKPDAEADLIFSQMQRAVDSLHRSLRDPTKVL